MATSDERIGVAVLRGVIQEQLEEVGRDVPPLSPPMETENLENEQEQQIVTQCADLIRVVGDRIQNDARFNDVIDGWGRQASQANFMSVVEKVFADGKINWGRIAVLFYAAGKMAVQTVKAHIPTSVRDIMKWTLDYFKTNLLGWIHNHGGWINSFSELARYQVERVSPMVRQSSALILMFLGGILLGSVITWRVTKKT